MNARNMDESFSIVVFLRVDGDDEYFPSITSHFRIVKNQSQISGLSDRRNRIYGMNVVGQ